MHDILHPAFPAVSHPGQPAEIDLPSATVLPVDAVPRLDAPSWSVETRFHRRLDSFQDLAADLWRDAGVGTVDLGPRHSLWRRWQRGRRLARQVDEMGRRLKTLECAAAEESMRRELPAFGRQLVRILGLGDAEANLLSRSDLTGATEDFVRQARGDDPDLAAEDLGQALRNVWVVHFFQLLVAGRVRHTQASLGYSLLYPYTDNVLDDPSRSPEQKRERSRRLGLRLAGIPLPPLDAAEGRVFQQLDRIDGEFPRQPTPEVHLALQAIHRSQVASLRQQESEPLDENELLRLSVAKGGSSVLVDAYLVDGRPTDEMARFAHVYGVALQLADDLQDVEVDLEAGHQTLFTRAARRGTLDVEFFRLVRFLDASLELCPEILCADLADADGPDRPDRQTLLSLARASMVHLMIQAVGAQPQTMPSSLRRCLARISPVTFLRARGLRRRLARLLDVSF